MAKIVLFYEQYFSNGKMFFAFGRIFCQEINILATFVINLINQKIKMKRLLIVLCSLLTAVQMMAAEKPRVIVMTDGEVDDRCSMVRFLLYTNNVEVKAIIETNSCFQRQGWSSDPWLEHEMDAYEQVYDNLKIHDRNYPTPAYLRSVCYVGDEDPAHVVVDGNAPARLPGEEPVINPDQWADTPGSDRIVEVLLDNDPRPVYIQAWGGGNTVAKAFQKLRAEHAGDYDRAIRKAVVYNIWYQDGAGAYIEKYHPQATMLVQYHFSGTWDYGTLIYTDDFVSKYLHNGKNALGALYTQPMISEGDSPAFLYALGNGLRAHEHPTYGGWGGRFYKVEKMENVWRDTGNGDIRQWMEAALHDFQARLEWCITPDYAHANHHPKITLATPEDISVRSGETVTISADISDDDPLDVDRLWEQRRALFEQAGLTKESFARDIDRHVQRFSTSWSQDVQAGTYPSYVNLKPQQSSLSFTAPRVSEPQTIHILLEVTDRGFPSLTSYQRYIVTVNP